MRIAKQGLVFIVVGCCLIVSDWAVFVALTAVGLDPVAANIIGRMVGALLGFWANGWLTFGVPGSPRLGTHRFLKYTLLWTLMTAISTSLVTFLAEHITLQIAWLAKPIVEAGLAVVSFFTSRYWVYR